MNIEIHIINFLSNNLISSLKKTFTFVSMIFTIACVLETIIVIWILEIEKGIENQELCLGKKSFNKTTLDEVEQQQQEEVEEAPLEGSNDKEEFFSLVSRGDSKFNIDSDMDEKDYQDAVKKECVESVVNKDMEAVIKASNHEHIGRWRKTRVVKLFTTKLEGLDDFRTRLDLIFLIMMPLAYALFVILMFASNMFFWDDNMLYSSFFSGDD